MRIVVPALSADNVASRCLHSERLEHEVRVLGHDTAYAELVAELWRAGETFVIVEDDIAPWPGAIAELEACPHFWCGFHYCLPGRWDAESDDQHTALFGTNGCFKVAQEAMQAAPELCERWASHGWRTLDVALTAALRHVFGLEGGPSEHTFHVHRPAVAHAMHYRPEAHDGREVEVHAVPDPV
jgi:hypothetical protein